ncbi:MULTISPECIES: hypothetical protein [Paenibacillus]|nr:hypothetical protein [Paenibacillus odorifer]
MNLPKFLFTTFSYVKTHAIENATISNQESSYPHMLLLDQVEKLVKADPDYRFTGEWIYKIWVCHSAILWKDKDVAHNKNYWIKI